MNSRIPEIPLFAGVEASRRATEEATAVVRQAAERGMKFSGQLFELWTASAEANLKAAFALQNAVLNAGRSLVNATGSGAMFDPWADMVHQTQQATLEAWQVGKHFGEMLQEKI